MSRIKDAIVAGLVLLAGRGRPPVSRRRPRVVPPGSPEPGAELLAIALLGLAGLCAAAFIAVYALDRIPDQTQFLGVSLGLALVFVALALLVVSKQLVVTEELAEAYPPDEHADEAETVDQIVEESGSRVTRRGLFKLALGGTGAVLLAALLAPAASLGPVLDVDSLFRTAWRRGRRLVGEDGKPLRADEIEQETFYTAYPEGADREQMGAPLVLVRLDPAALELPAGREGWAPQGILAFSKICTHAGCAIALYRAPTFAPTQPGPALVRPGHYSPFDPAKGAEVTFGPAGRPLPQLPLTIDTDRRLRAAGTFSGPVGPSWSGVRSKPAS